MKFTYLAAVSILSISSQEVKFIRVDQCWKQLAVNKYLFSIVVVQAQHWSLNKQDDTSRDRARIPKCRTSGTFLKVAVISPPDISTKVCKSTLLSSSDLLPSSRCMHCWDGQTSACERLPSGRNGGLGILIYSLGMLLLCWTHRTKSNLRLARIIIPSSFYNKTSFHGLAWRKYPKPDCRSSRGLWLKSLLLR